VISGYTHFERSYDRMLGNADSIYRVESRFYKNDQLTDDWATSTNGYATAMKKEFPVIAELGGVGRHGRRDRKYRDAGEGGLRGSVPELHQPVWLIEW